MELTGYKGTGICRKQNGRDIQVPAFAGNRTDVDREKGGSVRRKL